MTLTADCCKHRIDRDKNEVFMDQRSRARMPLNDLAPTTAYANENTFLAPSAASPAAAVVRRRSLPIALALGLDLRTPAPAKALPFAPFRSMR